MGLHECGHVRLFTTVWVLPGQMCDRGNTGVVETGDDELKKKKRVCFIRCWAAKRPSVPAASSQRGRAVRGAGETMRSLDGILLPTAVSDSITFRIPVATWKHPGSMPASWASQSQESIEKLKFQSSRLHFNTNSLITDTLVERHQLDRQWQS